MNETHFTLSQRTRRAVLALVAALGLIGGAAWSGIAADHMTAQKVATAATVTSPITHAIAGGRDSYADIVDVVAPAVVTIRAEGKAKVTPTQFEGPDDDMLRRFSASNSGSAFHACRAAASSARSDLEWSSRPTATSSPTTTWSMARTTSRSN